MSSPITAFPIPVKKITELAGDPLNSSSQFPFVSDGVTCVDSAKEIFSMALSYVEGVVTTSASSTISLTANGTFYQRVDANGTPTQTVEIARDANNATGSMLIENFGAVPFNVVYETDTAPTTDTISVPAGVSMLFLYANGRHTPMAFDRYSTYSAYVKSVLQTVGTEAVPIPIGTTAEQPASPITGSMRYNTTISLYEGYDGSAWAPVGSVFTGGTLTSRLDFTGANGILTLSSLSSASRTSMSTKVDGDLWYDSTSNKFGSRISSTERTLLDSGGPNVITGSASASNPVMWYTGSVFTGGTATTTVPFHYIQTTGSPNPTNWSTAGTVFGIQTPTGFTGNLLDFKNNNASRLSLDYLGNLTVGNQVTGTTVIAGDISGTRLQISGCSFGTNRGILWYSGNFTDTLQTGMHQNAPGVVEFNNGTKGTLRDWKARHGELADGNLILGTTTGTKIGTATSQKLAFWNATPVIQQTTSITAAAFVANTSGTVNDSATYGGYTIGQIAAALKLVGFLA